MGTVLWGESYVSKSSHVSPGRGWMGMVEDWGTQVQPPLSKL